MTAPPRYRELEEEIERVAQGEGERDRGAGVREGRVAPRQGAQADAEEAASSRRTGAAEDVEEQPEVGEDEIADIVSMWTGIPVFKLTEAESQKLDPDGGRAAQARDRPGARRSSPSRRRSAAPAPGSRIPKRPTGSFIFLGPSGVGKTELARTLAEFLFGDEDAMIQIDMSEYMEKHSVSRLVGSPPGYVGYDEGGQLTEAVRRKPYSVLLLDEIEKAHPDVFNILLQILEEGKLTDAQGRKVDFRNTIVIMTSNIGAGSDLEEPGARLHDRRRARASRYDDMKGRVMGELKKVFRPELLNRIDEIIVFHKLEKERDPRRSST